MKFLVEFDLEREKIPIDYRSCFFVCLQDMP